MIILPTYFTRDINGKYHEVSEADLLTALTAGRAAIANAEQPAPAVTLFGGPKAREQMLKQQVTQGKDYTMGDWFKDLENPHGNR